MTLRDSRSRPDGVRLNQNAQGTVRQQRQSYQSAPRQDPSAEVNRIRSLSNSLNGFFGAVTSTVADESRRNQQEEAIKIQNQAVRAADDAYREFETFYQTEWNPDSDDLTARADQVFQERFGEYYEDGESVYGQTAYKAFYQRALPLLGKAENFKAKRNIEESLGTLGQNLTEELRDPTSRVNFTSLDFQNNVQEVLEIKPTFTEGEATAYVVDRIYEGLVSHGHNASGWFERFVNEEQIGKNGETFAQLFPERATALQSKLFATVNEKHTYKANEALGVLSARLPQHLAQEDVQGLQKLREDMAAWEDRYGSNSGFRKLNAELNKQYAILATNLDTRNRLRDLTVNPSNFKPIDREVAEEQFLPTLRGMGLMDVENLNAQQMVRHGELTTRYIQRFGNLPPSYRSQLSYGLTDTTNPELMSQSLRLASTLPDEVRKQLFKDNNEATVMYAAYEVMQQAGVSGADSFVSLVSSNGDIPELYASMDFGELFEDGFESVLVDEEIYEDVVDTLGAGGFFGEVDDVDAEDVRFSPASIKFIEQTARMSLAIEKSRTGLPIDEDTVIERVRNIATTFAGNQLSLDQTSQGGLFTANQWTINRNEVRYRNDWGGPQASYEGMRDDYGRQEVRAIAGTSVMNPLGVEEDTFSNMRQAVAEVSDIFDTNGEISITSSAPDSTGGSDIRVSQDGLGGLISAPLYLKSGERFELNGTLIDIPQELTDPKELKALADALPKGIYPVVENTARGLHVKLKVFPHFREMDDFKDEYTRFNKAIPQ